MAVEFTPVAGKIKDSRGGDRTIQLKIGIDKNNPSNPPYIVDASNTNEILYQWNSTNKDWESTGSGSAALPVSIPSGGIQPTYDAFLNSNKQMFTENTTTVINKFSNQQKELWKESNTYQPYNTFVERSQAASQQSSTTSFSEAVQNPVPNPEIEGTESTDFNKEIMKYPFVIDESKQDYLKITAIEYRTRQIGSTSGGAFDFRKLSQGFSPRNEKRKRGTCYLPIQPVILDQNVVNWGPENMDAFSALFAQASYAIARQPGQTLEGFRDFTGALGALGGDDNVQNALRLSLAGYAVGNQSFFTRITGAIINPNLELLFNGPTLRTFNYSFRLSPRNTKEAKSVRTIIRFFKEMSVVRTANNALFLKSPNVFKLEYFKGSNERSHPSLNKIKTCALTSMTVNYTPDNSYMTFVDEYSTMTSYDMALTFQELEPVYDKDYKDLQDKSEIGF
jgi:hypothetical protein